MNMKKILIITVQKAPNYGACLQAYALWKYITDLGHECQIIDLLRPYHKEFIYTKGYDPMIEHERSLTQNIRLKYLRPLKNKIRLLLKGKKDVITNNSNLQSERSELLFNEFNNKILYTKKYRSIKDLYNCPPEADVYITGSDQLWNPTQPYALEPYFLTFVKNGGKRISYATSIGVSYLSKYTKKKFKSWLENYDVISVREQQGVEIIKNLTNKHIHQICDPTFLLPVNQWHNLAKKQIENERYIFLFTLGYDKNLYDHAANMQRTLNIKVIVNYNVIPQTVSYNFTRMKESGPIEWISYIKNADCVITNSFHGSVFSLLMHTPFKVGISNNRGSRIINLLQNVNAKECLIQDYNKHEIPKIDFNDTDKHIGKMQSEGRLFLKNSL